MWTFWIHLVVTLFIGIPKISAKLDQNTQRIILNFYVNLENRFYPKYYEEHREDVILEEITNFNKGMQLKHHRWKRNNWHQNMDLIQLSSSDFYLFDDFIESSILSTPNAIDITIFSHHSVGQQSHCYAGVLQINHETNYGTISLHRHDINQKNWILVLTEHITNPSKVFSLSYSDQTFLIVAHESKLSRGMCEGITVFVLDDNMRLHFVQSLETATFADVSLWESNYNIFLALAYDHTVNEDSINVENKSPIYTWKGNHFDVHQYISTSNAKRIISFHIGSSMFLAIANHQNNYGATKIFSEIFKYDAHENKFISYQKLASDGAIDINFFCFREGTYEESFLIITNEVKSENKLYGDSQSVVYKYENNYFVPFQEIITQAVTRWFQLAVSHNSIQGQSERFVLLGISAMNKINVFQYNGWNFVNVPVEKSSVQISNEAIIKKCIFNDDSILAISDKTHPFIRITQPTFKYVNDIDQLESKLYTWCNEVKYAISCSKATQYNFENNTNDYLSLLKQNSFSNGVHLDKIIHLNSASIEKIETKSISADDMSLDNTVIQNINNLFSLFNFQMSSLKSLEQTLPRMMLDDGTIYMDSLHVDNVEFECDTGPCQLDNVEMVTLNDVDVGQYQREVLYTDSINDFYDHVEFLDLVVENDLTIENINKKSIESLYLLIQQVAKMNGVFVNRNIYLADGLSVNGLLDNVKLSDEVVLLKDGDQILKGSFSIPQIKTTLLEAGHINDLTFEKIKEIVTYENKTISTPYILSQIVAENAFVEGLLNNINFQSLLTDTLKLFGDQNLNGAFTISNLDTLNVSVSSPVPENIVNQLITIDEGSFKIDHDVQFDNINLDSIFIGERLNDIPVVDNELSVMLLNSPKMQRVTGDKIFENVELMGPINLQGRINIPSLEKKNPVTMIEEPLILPGNFVIRGNVSVERFLTCDNLSKIGGRSSIKELQQRGLKLSERNIPMPLIFSQPLEVKNISCDTINGLKPTSWISTEQNNIVTITGRKMFSKNLNIRGSCSIVENINNVNPMILNQNIMKTYGDQLISGKIFLNSMTAKSLSCQNISFGGRPMDKMLILSGDHTIPGETVINFGAKVDSIMSTNILEVSGTISGYHIQKIIEDTVMSNSPKIDIFSFIVMTEPLNIRHLELEEIFSMNTQKMYSSAIWNRDVVFTELYINNPINVQNIVFDTSIAGISKFDFGSSWLLTEGDQVLRGNQIFENMNCFNDIYLETGRVNNIFLTELFNNIVWTSDNIFLKKAIFKNSMLVKHNLIIEGSLNNLYIPEDLILRNHYNYRNIFGHKILKNTQISGNVKSNYINGLSMEHICLLTQPDTRQLLPSLHINGSLHLHEEPFVNMLHNVDLENLLKNIWFSDTTTKLYGKNHFKKIKTTKSVEGRISLCGIDLHWLSENYLSLSRDQDITAAMKISTLIGNTVNVLNESFVQGNINEIILEDFHQNTLHTLGHQQIISPLDFDALSVNDNLDLHGNINNLNLRSDVFRINEPNNAVQKYFLEMEIHNLKLNSNYLKNIDLKTWADSVINKNDIQNYVIKGIKNFKTWESNNLSTSGFINGQIKPMDKILSKQNAQTISGKMSFIAKEKPLVWHSINVANRINDITITDAFKSLLLNNSGTSTFTSPKVFMSHVIANDGQIDGLINNVNFSSVAHALGSTEFLRDFNKEFNSMEQFSRDIYKNFKKRTHQIRDWRISQVIQGEIQCVTTLSSLTQDITHLILAVKNLQGNTEMHFYIWNSNSHTFYLDPGVTRYTFDEGIRKLFSVKLGKESTIIVEIGEPSSQGPPYRSDLYKFTPNLGISPLEQLNSNLTIAAASLQVLDKNCIFISYLYGACKLYCQEKHGDRSYLHLRQTMDIYSSDEIGVIIISDISYVILTGNNGTKILRWVGNENGHLASLQTLPPSRSLSAMNWQHRSYLALAEHQSVHVYMFNSDLQRFESHQDLHGTGGTRKVQFVTLPNSELALTALSPQSHFSLHLYQTGLGFRHKLNHTPSSHVRSVTNMRIGNEHVIALIGQSEISILKSIFKPTY